MNHAHIIMAQLGIKYTEMLQEITTQIEQLQIPSADSILTAFENSINFAKDGDYKVSMQWSKVVEDWCWERLHSGHWENVPVVYRKLYALATVLRGLALSYVGKYREALSVVVKGILLGAADVMNGILYEMASVLTAELGNKTMNIDTGLNMIDCTATLTDPSRDTDTTAVSFPDFPVGETGNKTTITSVMGHTEGINPPIVDVVSSTSIDQVCDVTIPDLKYKMITQTKRPKPKILFKNYKHGKEISEVILAKKFKSEESQCLKQDQHSSSSFCDSIERMECPSLLTFHEEYMLPKRPVILTGCTSYWPAMTTNRWSLEYLRKVAGPRTVPVEIGSQYTDKEWSQKLMTVNEFIDKFIMSNGNEKGYLAQHQLFDQIPQLRKDILVPDYCCMLDYSYKEGKNEIEEQVSKEDVKINAWFGPGGTVSPLHYDPQHNLLTQVFGDKYIRLYDKLETEYLYAHEGMLTNTSQVDLDCPDIDQFPLFQKAQGMECILKEGEMLYIPPQWWHYVRSLSLSFSVSFWWS